MSAQSPAITEADYVAPAMMMWEWFDMWALYEEWRAGRSTLVEADGEETPEEDSDKMSPEEQHDFYHKHFTDVLTDHTRMDRAGRQARWKDVEGFAKERGLSPDAARRVRSGGHDLKSSHSGFTLLDAAMRSGQHGHKLAKAAAKSREDKTMSKDPADNRGEVMAHLMTRHGHAQSGEDPGRLRLIHKRLEAREAHSATNKGTIDAHSEHGYDRIAADTNTTADEVRSIAKARKSGGHLSPIRNLAQQALKHAEGGGTLSHEWVAKGGARLIKMRNKSLEGKDRKASLGKAAVEKGAAEIKGKDGESTAVLDTATHTPGQARTALRISKPTKTGAVLHHPDSPDAKKGGEKLDSVDAHETLAKRLGLDTKASVNTKRAASELHKQGGGNWKKTADREAEELARKQREEKGERTPKSTFVKSTDKPGTPEEIAKTLKMPPGSVEGHIMRKRVGAPEAHDSGGRPGNPTVDKLVSKDEQRKKNKAMKPSAAVQADLHDLYPLRAPAKPGESEAETVQRHNDFAAKVKQMYHGDPGKGVPAKPHLKDKAAKDVEKMGNFGSPSKAHAGFAGAGRGGLDHPGDAPEGATEAAKAKHQAKLNSFHDTLATAHEGVHKVMAPVLAAMADSKHPENLRHKEHYSALKSAELSGDSNRVKQLEKEAKEKRLHSDLLSHHLNLASDNPEVHHALGVTSKAHAVTALGNIFKRVETHGANYAKTAIGHGAGEQKGRPGPETDAKRRQLHRPGEPLARTRVPGEKSGAGGDVEAPEKSGEHKPEQFTTPPKKVAAASDAAHQATRSAHVPGALARQQTDQGRGQAQANAVKKLGVQSPGTPPAGPRGPSDEKLKRDRLHSADLDATEKARAAGHEPGTPAGRTPLGADPEKLLRIRNTTPGTGSAITKPTTGSEPRPRSGKEALDRAFGEKTHKPGVVIQRAEGGRAAPMRDLKFTKTPKQEEGVLTRQELVMNESKTLFNRLAL
jgi:hypothetical protein